jgi:hypothetical protein
MSPLQKIKIYRTVILYVLYGCETWSLTLREEHRLRVFENSMLRRIFGPKREEVVGGQRRLHNEELHNLNTSPNFNKVIKSRSMRGAWNVVCILEMRNVYKILVRKPEGKKPHEDLGIGGRLISECVLRK